MMEQFDDYVIRALNQFAGKNPAFDALVATISDSAILKGAAFMAYLWWLWFRRDDAATARRESVVVTVVGTLAAALLARLLQLALPFHRRPLFETALGFHVPAGVDPASLNHWNSFPSDHAVLFFALSTAVWMHSRALGMVAVAWTLIVVSLPRLYLGFHYPSDIIGGAIFGVLIMLTTHRLLRRSSLPGRVLGWESAHSAAFFCIAFLLTYEISLLFNDLRRLAVDGFHLLLSLAN